MKLLSTAFLLVLIIPMGLNTARADASNLCSPAPKEVSPLRDAADYMIWEPANSIRDFFLESVDDLVEDGFKIVAIYLAYYYTPLANSALRYKISAFPIVYTVANHLGDRLGDMVEEKQPRPSFDDSKDVLRSFANDIGEDTTKLFCYLMKFAKGAAPSRAAAEFIGRVGIVPVGAVQAMHLYAYFSAVSKVASDFQFCENTANAYGDWLEARVADLQFFAFSAISARNSTKP